MGTKNWHTPLTGTSEALSHTNLNSIFAALAAAITSVTFDGTAGEALSERDFVYLNESDNQWYKLVSTSAAGRWIGCVVEDGGIASAGSGAIRLQGKVDGFTGLTVGSVMYAWSIPGGYTQTRPTVTDGGTQKMVCVLGFAVSTTEMALYPQRPVYMKRATLADNGELTITHHSNPATRARMTRAYVADTYDEPLFIGTISGDAQEVGVEFGDGSGSDQDTKTTFKNLTGAGADITCVVEIL